MVETWRTTRSPSTVDDAVDTRRLQLLLALSRLGSMRAVAESFHLTTSTVSQQIAALARDTGTRLIEPEGRRVRPGPVCGNGVVQLMISTVSPVLGGPRRPRFGPRTGTSR